MHVYMQLGGAVPHCWQNAIQAAPPCQWCMQVTQKGHHDCLVEATLPEQLASDSPCQGSHVHG